VYLEARRIAEEAGFSVGWMPFDEGEPLEMELRDPMERPHPLPVD
jgi:hypothetical protein